MIHIERGRIPRCLRRRLHLGLRSGGLLTLRDCPCDIVAAGRAEPIVSPRLIPWSSAEARADAIDARGAVMEGAKLLLVFLITLLIGQSISVSVGLLVERQVSPYTGLLTFIACYFAMFWVAWRFAVRITEPRSRRAADLKPMEDAG
jgi:hypothetical protein